MVRRFYRGPHLDFGNIKGCPDFLGELLQVPYTWYVPQLHPPSWGAQLPHLPFKPHLHIGDRALCSNLPHLFWGLFPLQGSWRSFSFLAEVCWEIRGIHSMCCPENDIGRRLCSNFWIDSDFWSDFCSSYGFRSGFATSPSPLDLAFLCCSEEPLWYPALSGRPPWGLLHMFPMNSVFLLEVPGLLLWWNIHAYAAYPPGRKVYLELLFSFVNLHRRGNPGTSLAGRHFVRCL